MPHVVTQSCCSDGSCVYACPVNCIHPSPDEPGFATAEMLYIDPVSCVDCGACVSACPVGAIAPDTRLTAAQLPFIDINAAFYPARTGKVPPTSKLAPVIAPAVVVGGAAPLSVAIVGSGPAAMYAADELLTQSGVSVNVFEKLPTPYGLVRAGVAPDHPKTKAVTNLFDTIAAQPGFRFHLNVEVGSDISHAELAQYHHAVLYAVGAPTDRRLAVDGMGLPGTATATEIVAWFNGHPDYADWDVNLSQERVVIVGNGNVALDVARILTAAPDDLAGTDIADHALAALRSSRVREVVIAARRGPAHSAFTLPELIGLTTSANVTIDSGDRDLVLRDLADATDPLVRGKLEILAKLGAADTTRPHIRFAYHLTPTRVLGTDQATGIAFTRTGTEDSFTVPAGLVLTSIGYRGRPVADLPFDDGAGVVPNERGRVHPGSYVAGWIKRGPSGFIGTNKSCAQETVGVLVEDYNAGLLAAPTRGRRALDALIRSRVAEPVDARGWRAIDAAEIERGAIQGRPRRKFTAVAEMLAVAAAAPPPSRWDRLRDALATR